MANSTLKTPLGEEYVRFVTEAWADPRPFYDRLREEAPVFWTPLNHWFISSFDEASSVWRDNERWSQTPVLETAKGIDFGEGPTTTLFTETILSLNGDAHKRLREPVNTVFTPRGIEGLGDIARETVARLMDHASAGRNGMEFLRDFAMPLPTTVVLDIFGLDHSEYDRFSEAADIIIECYEAMGSGHYADDLVERANRVIGETAEHIKELAAERSANPDDKLLSQLVRTREEYPDRMTESELASIMMFIVTAGFETTMYTACNLVYHLLKNPDQLERVRNDRSLIRSAVEEVLRFEPGVYISSPRYANQDMAIAGQQIRRGDKCLISNHAANHDPAAFEDPHRFDVTRSPNRQMSFGRGRHTCLGAHLARLELAMTLEALLDRFPNLELVTEELEWTTSHVLRGPKALQLRW